MHPKKRDVFFAAMFLFSGLNSIRASPAFTGEIGRSGDTMHTAASGFKEGRGTLQAGLKTEESFAPAKEAQHGGSLGVAMDSKGELTGIRKTGGIAESHGEGHEKLNHIDHTKGSSGAGHGAEERHWTEDSPGDRYAQNIVRALDKKEYGKMTGAQLKKEIEALENLNEYMWMAYKNSPGKGSWLYRNFVVPLIRFVAKWRYKGVIKSNAKAMEYISKGQISKAAKKVLESNRGVVKQATEGKLVKKTGWDAFSPSDPLLNKQLR